jgi:hypothetical protein
LGTLFQVFRQGIEPQGSTAATATGCAQPAHSELGVIYIYMALEVLSIAETYLVYFGKTHKVVAGITAVLRHSISYLSTDAGHFALGDKVLCPHVRNHLAG